ncbi:MAG: hypothetical protein ACXWP1_06170 [Bdellovibrionota bacterium]
MDYKKGLRLRVSNFTGELSLRGSGGRVSLEPLSHDDLGRFLPEFFRQWAATDREGATKAAFDYIDAQRGFVAIAFVASLLVALPVTVALLADSHQQFQCTRELEAHAVPGVMKVTKLRKVDSRNFNVNLEFTTPEGKVIKGQEVILTAQDIPPPMEFPFLYSPERPDCWSLTKTAGDANDPHRMESHELNWAKRRYFAWFGMLFGFFFLAVTGFGLAWSMGRWLRPRPFSKEVAAAVGLSV